MALRLAGEDIAIQEVTDNISYVPDLEMAIKTIEIVDIAHHGLMAATVFIQLPGTGTPTTLNAQQTRHALTRSTGVGLLPPCVLRRQRPRGGVQRYRGCGPELYIQAVTFTLRRTRCT